jgi:hypothetical protein
MQRIAILLVAVTIIILASGCCGRQSSCTRDGDVSACSDATPPSDAFLEQTSHFAYDRPDLPTAPVVFAPPAE